MELDRGPCFNRECKFWDRGSPYLCAVCGELKNWDCFYTRDPDPGGTRVVRDEEMIMIRMSPERYSRMIEVLEDLLGAEGRDDQD